MATFEFDEEILHGFIAEAQEDLASIESDILQLEDTPADTDLLNAIFRPIHSIKGNSAFFNLNALKQLTHEFENLLDALRRGRQPVLPETISLLLQGTDLTQQAIARAAAGEFAEELTAEETVFLQRLEHSHSAPPPEAQLLTVRNALQELVEHIRTREMQDLDALGEALASVAQGVVISDAALEAARPASAADAPLRALRAYIMGGDDAPPMAPDTWEGFTAAAQDLRTVLGTKLEEVPELATGLDELVADVKAMVDSPLDPDAFVLDIFVDRLNVLEPLVHEHAPAAPDTADAADMDETETAMAAEGEEAAGPATGTTAGRTMRISESAVDEFMTFVGDLIMTGEVFHYLEKRMAIEGIDRHLLRDFQEANQGFDELSAQLRESLMGVRKLPLRQVLQKVPRTVRDLCAKVGKQVEVIVEGEKLTADKRIIEKLEAPVMHAVRNCIDHGIEMPDVRRAAGKPEAGRVAIIVVEEAEALKISISDDGAGLNPVKLRAAAVAKGMYSEAAAADLSDRDVIQLIFAPGFSTAEIVTDISGRGVGMDVVRTNLTEIGGEVDVQSAVGEGTTVTFTLPLSNALMVINCLVTRLGEDRYMVPAEHVRRAVAGADGALVDVAGKGEVFSSPDGLFALVRLADLLGTKMDATDVESATVLLLEHEGRTAALLVDEVITLQPVVVKELPEAYSATHSFMGSAMMGDGRITLVLNVPSVITRTGARTNGAANGAPAAAVDEADAADPAPEPVLTATDGADALDEAPEPVAAPTTDTTG